MMLTHDNIDAVLCMMVEFVRLELGQPADATYGAPTCEDVTRDLLNDENWSLDDEIMRLIYGGDPNEAYDDYGTSEYHMIRWVRAWKEVFENVAKFEEHFPCMAYRRLNMSHTLRPIFDLDWIFDHRVIDDAVRYAKRLLAVTFDENRPRSDREADRLSEAA